MKDLSDLAQHMLADLSAEIALHKSKSNTANSDMSFDIQDAIKWLKADHRPADSAMYFKQHDTLTCEKAFQELINAGLLLQGLNRRVRIADPNDIVKQKMNRGSNARDPDNVS